MGVVTYPIIKFYYVVNIVFNKKPFKLFFAIICIKLFIKGF